MLARLLRQIYLFQVIGGALLGAFLATRVAPGDQWSMATLAFAGALILPLGLQWVVIAASMVRSSAQMPNALWWRAFWGEFRAALVVFGLRQPRPLKSRGIEMPASGNAGPKVRQRVPVVLVHGYLCNHRVWDNVACALRDAGHPVLAIDLEPLFTSIDNYAPLIEQAVTALANQCKVAQVALVGHSMGGLAIRAWMRTYGTHRAVRVITLGTPHQGTRIANSSMTPNGAQMVWHSEWLNMLERSESSASRQLMQIALTPQDNIVYPQCEQVLPGAAVTQFSGLGHLELCLDPGVIAWIAQQLATLEP